MPSDLLPPPSDPAAVVTTRTVTHRRGLPSPRAALGAFLVCLAVLGTLLVQRRAQAGPDSSYLIATESVAPGTPLTAGDVRLIEVDLPAEVARHAYADPASLEGAITVEPLEAGELIEDGDVLRARPGEELSPPPHHDVTLSLERDRALDGDLTGGERVDLLATYGTDREAETLVVAADARVLAVDAGDDALGSAGLVTVTLTVDEADTALRIAHAAEVAAVRLVRRTGSDAAAGDTFSGPQSTAGGNPSPGDPQG